MKLATETRTPSEGRAGFQKFHTKLGISLLSEQGQASDLPPQEPPSPPETEGKAVEVSGTANFAVVVHGNLHVHEHFHEHLHLENPPRSAPKRIEEMPQPVKVGFSGQGSIQSASGFLASTKSG